MIDFLKIIVYSQEYCICECLFSSKCNTVSNKLTTILYNLFCS